jgi:hypothetical protein
MGAAAIACGKCACAVPAEFWNQREGVRCPGCGGRVEVAAFPAMEGPHPGAQPEAVDGDTEASCFYHPESRAATPCDQCGRFLCRLCELEVDGRHLCPACFQAGLSRNQIETAVTFRPMHDTAALALSTFPALLFWPVVVTAPWTLVMVIRHWRTPLSIVPRTRIRFVLAAIFALAEIVGIGLLIFVIARLPRQGAR